LRAISGRIGTRDEVPKPMSIEGRDCVGDRNLLNPDNLAQA